MIFSCMSCAFGEEKDAHSITMKTYPFYLGSSLDDMLNQEFPLYFVDGVADLPYADVRDGPNSCVLSTRIFLKTPAMI